MFESRFLRRRLVLPLSVLTAVSLCLAVLVPWGGLFVNLATTFLGILLTVGYVEIVLREQEARTWVGGLARIAKRLDSVATVSSNQFRTAFGFAPDVYDWKMMASPSDKDRRTETARVARDVLRPVVWERVKALDTAGWIWLCKQLEITWNAADRLIELFGPQLGPDTIATLIDMQDHLKGIMDRYATFPDLLGIRDADLKPNLRGESLLPHRRVLEGMASDDMCAILDESVELFDISNRLTLLRSSHHDVGKLDGQGRRPG